MSRNRIVLLVIALVVVVILLYFLSRSNQPSSEPPQPVETTAATTVPSPSTPAAEDSSPLSTPAQQQASPLSPLTTPGQFESPLGVASPWGTGVPWPEGRLVFHSDQAGTFQIFAVVDGQGPVLLTGDLDKSVEPAFSPDGQQIAFTYYATEPNGPDNTQIYLMNADGSNKRPLMENQPNLNWRPAWSPDGQQLLFISNRDGNFEIYKVNVDGTGLVNLTNSPSNDHDPDWSPDGSKIVFVSDRDYGVRAIYTMNPDGSDVQEIVGPECLCSYPRWSPDGSQILYASKHDTTWDLFVMNPDGSGIRQITSGSGDNFIGAWVGNDRIIFAAEEASSVGTDLYLVHLNGDDLLQLTNIPYTEESFPHWVP
ncbi:MAG: hypothetical protein KatS3mg050_3815 [Litorilinea sp.]|nr:MAG: hypothetical protein KatS3mg050_3815 [Litorilinea sp.]